MTTSDWSRLFVLPVGGLTELGVSGDEELILVVSHQGRGVYQSDTGTRLARDRSEPSYDSPWLNEADRLAEGIGPLQGMWVPVVGLWGSTLPTTFGNARVEIKQVGTTEVVRLSCSDGSTRVIDEPATVVRAFGFTGSGKLLLATSSDLQVWRQAT